MSNLRPFLNADLPRLSVFVDADNISASQAAFILDLARRHGIPDLLRAYGNAHNLPDWDKVTGFLFMHSGSGKNATDMLICVDAMERALSQQCEAVLLVSSDQDFTHLATRLRERGLTVIGAGEAKTVARFREACCVFVELVASEDPLSAARPDDLDWKIHAIIQRDSKKGNGVALTHLSNRMSSEHDFRISDHPDRKWHTYLTQRDNLYVLHNIEGKQMVRFRREAFPTAA